MTFTHAGILERNDAEFATFVALVESLPAERLDEPFAGTARDRNVRDVVAHLHAWHILLERWHSDGAAGGSPRFPPRGTRGAGSTNSTRICVSSGRTRALAELLPLLKASHESLQAMVALHTDAELDDPAAYAWTRGSALGEYALECGGNHYAWGRATITAGLGLGE